MTLLSEKLTRIDNAVNQIKKNFDLDENTVIEEVAERANKFKPSYLSYKDCMLENLDNDLRQIDSSNLTSLDYLFDGCTKLKSVDLTNWVKPNITSMERMFDDCSSLESINITGWDCSNVTNTSSMFRSCKTIPEGFGDLTFPKMETISGMFLYCRALTSSSQIPNFDVSECTDFTNLFSGCYGLTEITNIKNWDTSSLTDMLQCFQDCSKLVEIDISAWDTSKVTRVYQTFSGCRELKTLSSFDGSSCTSLGYAFNGCNKLENFNGVVNYGKAFPTNSSENYYTFDLTHCTALTETSLINILNNLYDIKTKGCRNQKVKLGATNLAKLTSTAGVAALENAAAKGWNVE